MNAEIRFKEVNQLRSHLCQDYLKLLLQPNWQDKLFKCAKEKVEKNPNKYSPYQDVYVRMRKTNPGSISVKDLDVSLIMEIVGWSDDIDGIIDRSLQNGHTRSAFLSLKLDRDSRGHRHDNESDEVLYLKALLGLTRMDEFLTAFDKYAKKIPSDDRLALVHKYYENIVKLTEAVDDERTDLIQTKKEFGKFIKQVQDSNDPLKTWVRVYSIIQKKYWSSEDENDRKKYYDFLISASDSGIPYAHGFVLTFSDNINLDMTEQEKRMELILNDFNPLPPQEAKLIIGIVNGCISKGDYSEKMQQITQRVIDSIDPMYQVVKNNNNRFVLERKQQ